MADGTPMVQRRHCARDLVGLPGMPSTVQGVRIMAERERWTKHPKSCGKGWEYPESALPEVTRRELQRRAAISAANSRTASTEFIAGASISRRVALKEKIDEAAARRIREEGLARAAGLSGNARARMEARLDLLARVDAFAKQHGLGICAAREAFCAAVRNGEIAVADNVIRFIGSDVSPASIGRWQRMLATTGAASLAGEYGNRRGAGAIESQAPLRDFILGVLADKPHIGSKNLYRVLHAHFASRSDIAVPQVRSVARFLAHIKRDHAQMYTAMSNPDAWKNKYMPAFGSASEDVVRLNQRWELDSTPADVMLVDGRYTIVQVVDIWSRRRLFYVAKTSSAAAVCEALRRAVLAWGIPEQVKIDNGKDYTAERVQRGLKALGVEVMISPPFSPWKKPHVERGFHTFLHGLFELLPGYLGHNIAQAQAIRASKSFAERMFEKNATVEINMAADELQTFCDRWCVINESEPTEGLNGLAPRDQVARWTGEVRRITNERALDILLAEARDCTVQKKGLRIDSHVYIAPELAGLIREHVQAFYDERDIGRMVVYHNEEFVCVAECPELTGISRAEIAAAANAITKQRVGEQRAAMRKLKGKIKKADLVETVLALREEQVQPLALPPGENVLPLIPAIAAAAAAAEALDAKPAFDGVAEFRMTESMAQVRIGELAQNETAEQRFVRLLDVLLKDPAEHNDLERHRLKTYFHSDEFQARYSLLQDFGAAMLNIDTKYDALVKDGAFAYRFREAQLKGSF
jgi:putative transposase